MHYTAGLILSVVFQLDVVEETTNPSDELGQMDNTWAIHQLFTTTNFAQKRNCKLVYGWTKSPN
jgi:linoleoyl-CoA desaturase